VTSPRYSNTESRVRIRIGRFLSGGRNLYQRISPRFIHPPKSVPFPKPKTHWKQRDVVHSPGDACVPVFQGYDAQWRHGVPFSRRRNGLWRVPLKRGRPLSQGHHQGSSGWFSCHTSGMWLIIATLIHIVAPVKSIYCPYFIFPFIHFPGYLYGLSTHNILLWKVADYRRSPKVRYFFDPSFGRGIFAANFSEGETTVSR